MHRTFVFSILGLKGDPGADGSSGSQGEKGDVGDDGMKGEQGNTGICVHWIPFVFTYLIVCTYVGKLFLSSKYSHTVVRLTQ